MTDTCLHEFQAGGLREFPQGRRVGTTPYPAHARRGVHLHHLNARRFIFKPKQNLTTAELSEWCLAGILRFTSLANYEVHIWGIFLGIRKARLAQMGVTSQ